MKIYSFSVGSIAKREINEGPFTPEDIYIPSPPREVDGGIEVEYAVVKTNDDGTTVAVPSEALAKVMEARAEEIGRKIGGKVVSVGPKQPPPKPTSGAQTGGKNGGMIAGVVIAVLLTAIIAAVAVWYFRYAFYLL